MLRRAARVLLTVSVLAGAADVVGPDTLSRALPVRDAAIRASGDSLADSLAARLVKDTSLAKRRGMAKDTVVAKAPVSLPPRILTFQEQLLFAMVFMSFIGVMLASLNNINP